MLPEDEAESKSLPASDSGNRAKVHENKSARHIVGRLKMFRETG
jgi:hypothetical protein